MTRHSLLTIVVGCCWVGLMPRALESQPPQSAPLVLTLPASTAALSVGDVFFVSSRDSDGIFYNPAVLARARGIGLAAQHFARESTLLDGSGALPWFDGGVGIGLQALHYGTQAPDSDMGEDDLVEGGSVGVSELVGSLGYGRALGEVRLGAALKLIEERTGGERGATGALDLGATLEVDFLTLGLAVQNLGPALKLGDRELSLPDRVRLEASFTGWEVGPLDLGAAGAVIRRTDGEVIPAGGIEVAWWPVVGRTFIARVGARRVPDGPARPVTFGLAFWGDAFAIEYAFQGLEGPRDSHRLGLRWRR